MRALHLITAVLLCCCVVPTEGLAVCDSGPCDPGHFWNSTGCEKCPNGTYMKKEKHKCGSCIHCTGNKPDLVKIENCTATENTRYQCSPGSIKYSINEDDGPECKLCRQCRAGYRTVSECTVDKDTVCEPQSQTSDKAGNTINQSTEGSVGNESQTNRAPYWTNTRLNENQTWSTNETTSNSTSSITTGDRNSMIVSIVVLLCVLAALIVIFGVLYWCKYIKHKKAPTTNTEAEGAGDSDDTLRKW